MTRGEGVPRKNLSPLSAPPLLPSWEKVAAKRSDEGALPLPTHQRRRQSRNLSPLPHQPPYSPHDLASTDASATNVWAGSVRVPHGSPRGRPKADRWPDVDKRWGNPPTSHRGNPEGQRSGQHHFNNPQPEIAAISPKSRAHGAMDASYSL